MSVRARSTSRPKRRPAPVRTPQRRAILTPRGERLKERWDRGAQPILAEIRAKGTKAVAPYDTRENTLKREVYRLVLNLRNEAGGLNAIEVAVLANRKADPRTVTLQQNPFFWALFALADQAGLKRDRVTRLSQEMVYAWRHGIDPDLFVGFVMQTGANRIYAAGPSDFEPWKAARDRAEGGKEARTETA